MLAELDHRQLSSALLALADRSRSAAMSAYMRDQFAFLGVGAPLRRAAVKALYRRATPVSNEQVFAVVHDLWNYPEREYQHAAIDLLALHSKRLSASELPILLALAQSKSWWDSVDGLASVVGKILKPGHEHMDAAIVHENMWVRRIALTHQLTWHEQTDADLLFSYALKCAHENEFFIQKAIGWALRDYARHQPLAVAAFTAEYKDRLSALSYREATKHLNIDH